MKFDNRNLTVDEATSYVNQPPESQIFWTLVIA
jgi:hypothetical protein